MKIVYSYYVLDIIHKGHILMMKAAKELAGPDGKSIVAILTDKAVMEKKAKPTLSFAERMEIAEAIKYADIIVPQETYSPLPNVKKIRPNILMESTSHTEEAIRVARTVMKKLGGEVFVIPYYPEQSSTTIKEKVKNHE